MLIKYGFKVLKILYVVHIYQFVILDQCLNFICISVKFELCSVYCRSYRNTTLHGTWGCEKGAVWQMRRCMGCWGFIVHFTKWPTTVLRYQRQTFRCDNQRSIQCKYCIYASILRKCLLSKLTCYVILKIFQISWAMCHFPMKKNFLWIPMQR